MMPKSVPGGFRLMLLVLLALAVWVAFMSFVYVGKDETGHLVRIYLGDDLKKGAIIATSGEKGPQAEFLPPGFHPQPFLRVLYDVTMEDVVEIPAGSYGYLVARDGRPLRTDQTYAVAARLLDHRQCRCRDRLIEADGLALYPQPRRHRF